MTYHIDILATWCLAVICQLLTTEDYWVHSCHMSATDSKCLPKGTALTCQILTASAYLRAQLSYVRYWQPVPRYGHNCHISATDSKCLHKGTAVIYQLLTASAYMGAHWGLAVICQLLTTTDYMGTAVSCWHQVHTWGHNCNMSATDNKCLHKGISVIFQLLTASAYMGAHSGLTVICQLLTAKYYIGHSCQLLTAKDYMGISCHLSASHSQCLY